MKRDLLKALLVFILISWTILYRLDFQPLYMWDESRQANNAIEMFESGNFLYPTYDGNVDFWNTKPHLLIIAQALSFKVLGPGILALRLPSALAAILAVWLWFLFLSKIKGFDTALLFVIILLSCRGFNVYHIGRTGDYDAFLILFLSGAIINWYSIIVDGYASKTAWKWAGFFLMAVLSKSLAALLWLPVFGVTLLLFANTRDLISAVARQFAAVMFAVSVYYFYREWLNPGYLKAVWVNEIVGRYMQPNEGHVSEWYYYFSEIYYHYFEGFVFFILFTLPLLLGKYSDKLIQYLMISILTFLGIISLSATRIHWYLAPSIPLMSALVAIGIIHYVNGFLSKTIFGIICLISLLVIAFWQNGILWKENNTIHGVYPQLVLQKADKSGALPHRGIWLHQPYNPIEKFYSRIFRQKNIEFTTTDRIDFKKGDTVYLYNFEFTDSLPKYYHATQFHAPDPEMPIWIFTIDSSKSATSKNTEKL